MNERICAMKYSETQQGRTFVIRLEDGDIVHEEIEKFAREQNIQSGFLIILGGADKGSKLVVGPEQGRATPVVPIQHVLENIHEIAGTGTIFPDEKGKPVTHIHIACGRKESTKTGCARAGVKVWYVMEIVLIELVKCKAKRVLDSATGFELLEP